MSINKVFLAGNLTRDPELRQSGSGTSVLRIGLAVNDRKKNQSTGDWENVPNYFDVVLFGARAEGLSSILAKGNKIAVEGKLHWSQWENPAGEKRSKVEVYADEIELFGGPRTGGDLAGASTSTAPAEDLGGEEIPF